MQKALQFHLPKYFLAFILYLYLKSGSILIWYLKFWIWHRVSYSFTPNDSFGTKILYISSQVSHYHLRFIKHEILTWLCQDSTKLKITFAFKGPPTHITLSSRSVPMCGLAHLEQMRKVINTPSHIWPHNQQLPREF